jgi:hypothetical protein
MDSEHLLFSEGTVEHRKDRKWNPFSKFMDIGV